MAKAKTEKAALPEGEMTPEERRARVSHIIAQAEKTHGPGCVQRASDTHASYLLRRPTGLISLDIAMAGGFPAAAPSVIVGPDSSGKDHLLWKTGAEAQRLYGDNFCMAVYFTEFKPDKLYMKDHCGFHVAFSETEIEELDAARHQAKQPSLNKEEIDWYRFQIGEFIPIYGISADHGFDEVFNFLEANVCQIIAVNSIGFMQTEAKENKDSFEEFAQQRNEAALLSKVMPKVSMYLNAGAKGGCANETSLILVNQVRSKDQGARTMPGRVPQEKDGYKTAANAWALKHGKAIELFIHNGSSLYDEASKTYIGRKKSWEITKGKLGTHEGKRGEFNYFYGEGADIFGDLLTTAKALEVIQVGGSWLSYDAEAAFRFKVQSEAKAVKLFRESPELVDHLRMRCMQVSNLMYRHK